MSEFTVREIDLSAATGLSKYEFKKRRDQLLEKGVDFSTEKNAIVLTPAAALKVLVDLEVSSPANLLEKLSGGESGEKNGGARSSVRFPEAADLHPAEKNGAKKTAAVPVPEGVEIVTGYKAADQYEDSGGVYGVRRAYPGEGSGQPHDM